MREILLGPPERFHDGDEFASHVIPQVMIEALHAELSGGDAINDALLSARSISAAGAGPVIVLWDRTKGSADVKVIAALGEQPNYLITSNPNVKTLKDFTKADKIALPAVIVSQQSRLLQIAAEKEFGEGKYNSLDELTVMLPHPDATAALLSGSSSITAHFSNPPFQEQALQNPKSIRS
ncbi:hypothetical protein [Bradyrhizobium sp. Leo121]|uniref:hypothetical protein n=1 Tax=Bradyrhizobium sp. Leo121 TaxID=1571195 RepID=UPI001FDEE55F|nr:hypothetical protein [Bradyrhizobium sp. Leo121]